MKLEALADVNIEEMFKEASDREEKLKVWVKEQKDKIDASEQESYDDNSIGLLFGVAISMKDTLK